MPLALPALALGAVVAVLTRRGVAHAQAHAQPAATTATPPPPPDAPPPPPSPIAVFVQFLEAKLTPPDLVIWCACAEAEMNGNTALARQIADRFPEAMARRQAPAAAPAATPAHGAPTPAAPAPAAAPLAPMTPAIAHAMAPASAQASPIDGISDEQWRALCERLVRGDAAYNSERRIGRYHQRKDRLREIGFDPESLLGAPEAQDDAFAADMTDTYRHLQASGELAKHVGRPISIPDAPDGIPITLSGLFGVASVAGLEDMMEWLGSKSDRKKFPNTTAAFMRANGIF